MYSCAQIFIYQILPRKYTDHSLAKEAGNCKEPSVFLWYWKMPPDVNGDSLEKTPMVGEIEGRRRRVWQRWYEMAGWHHRLDGHEFEQAQGVGDGQGGLACCRPGGHKESDMTEWLNFPKLVSSGHQVYYAVPSSIFILSCVSPVLNILAILRLNFYIFLELASNHFVCMHAKSLQLWPTLCNPIDCSLPGTSVHGILQARILEWVAMLFSK